MNPLITIVLCIVLSPRVVGTTIDCKSFQIGTFRLVDKELSQEYLIERDGATQVEKDVKNGTTSKFKVTWISDCEYELDILEGREEVMKFYKGKTLTIRILETFQSGYKYEAQLKGTEMKVIHTVEKVN